MRSLFTTIFLFLGLATSIHAMTYPTPIDFDGTLTRWEIDQSSGPVTYEIKADREVDLVLFGQTIHDAAAMWTDVRNSYFQYSPMESDDAAMVTINLQLALEDAPFSAGYALFDEVDANNNPTHCSIFIGLNAHESFQGVAKTILHELGHCVGLGHSLVGKSIMSYQLKENDFELDIDDEAAISRLYPADGSEPQVPAGCSVGATRKSIDILSLLILLLPIVLCLNRKKTILRQ